jgi:YHS domain-containing protein
MSHQVEKEEKIACHVCRKIIPKAAALHAEGKEYVHYFCNTACLEHWKNKQVTKDSDS